jgi:ankyrin repeat protein
MSEKKSRAQIWIKIVPTLIFVCLLAWCTTNGQRMKQMSPIKTELQSIFLENGLVDSANPQGNLADVAKRMGEPALNNLLYEVASSASLDALKWIVANGADPKNIGTIRDLTLLQKVALRPRLDRMEYFLGFGLNPLERSKDGRTILHLAAQGGLDQPVLALLLSKGLKITDTDIAGRMPIHYSSVKSVSVLVAAGAEVDAKDSQGLTALLLAAKEGRNDVASELLNNAASVYVVDNKGRTALHHAAIGRNADAMIDTLLAAGAPVTARDNEGQTPKDLALAERENSRENSHYRSAIDKL